MWFAVFVASLSWTAADALAQVNLGTSEGPTETQPQATFVLDGHGGMKKAASMQASKPMSDQDKKVFLMSQLSAHDKSHHNASHNTSIRAHAGNDDDPIDMTAWNTSCGGHKAASCELCPKTDDTGATVWDHGSEWCNGDCQYFDGECHHKQTLALANPNWAPTTEDGLWPQVGANGSRCSSDTSADHTVANQTLCQDEAILAGLIFYQYAASTHQCSVQDAYIANCEDDADTNAVGWAIYQKQTTSPMPDLLNPDVTDTDKDAMTDGANAATETADKIAEDHAKKEEKKDSSVHRWKIVVIVFGVILAIYSIMTCVMIGVFCYKGKPPPPEAFQDEDEMDEKEEADTGFCKSNF